MNYPVPEIYKTPGDIDVNTLDLEDLIVDGQQRITTIVNFIDGNDVFAFANTPIKFAELNDNQKKSFLSYEVSVRYLKDATKAQIKEIFQRINNTEYSLNKMERLNAQWGDSEFVCYAKQLIEEALTIDSSLLEYQMGNKDRKHFLSFFHDKKIFTENDNNRMLSLQYVLTLISTLIKGEYFRRNDETQGFIELYNDNFDDADYVTEQLKQVTEFIHDLQLDDGSYWFNKANMFTLLCELYQYDVKTINSSNLREKLVETEGKYKIYLGNPEMNIESDLQRYFEYAREGVNEKNAREHRGKVIQSLLV